MQYMWGIKLCQTWTKNQLRSIKLKATRSLVLYIESGKNVALTTKALKSYFKHLQHFACIKFRHCQLILTYTPHYSRGNQKPRYLLFEELRLYLTEHFFLWLTVLTNYNNRISEKCKFWTDLSPCPKYNLSISLYFPHILRILFHFP